MNTYPILFTLLGFFLSINQGFTVTLGMLSDGTLRGADVLMPMDVPLYLLLMMKRDQTRSSRKRPLVLAVKAGMLIFFLLALSGEFISVEPAQFRFKLVHLARALLVCYVLMTRLSTRKEVLRLSEGLLLGLAFQSAVGFWQWQIGPISIPFFPTVSDWRVSGTIGVANAFGTYLVTLIPLCIRMSLFSQVKSRFLWYPVAVMSLGSLLATYTRAAWLGFALSMVFMAFYELRQKKLNLEQKAAFLLLGIAFVVVMAVKYGDVIVNRMSDSEETLLSERKESRLNLAKDALRIIDNNRLLGVGLDNYRYYADKEIQGLRMVHNAYLLIAAEQGIPALLIFIGLNIMVTAAAFRLLKSNDRTVYNVGFSVFCGLTAILIYHMAAPDYRLQEVLVQHWRLLGMTIGLLIVDEKLDRARRRPRAETLASARRRIPPANGGRF